MVPQAELIVRVTNLWFLALSQLCRDSMDPFENVFNCVMKLLQLQPENIVGTMCPYVFFPYLFLQLHTSFKVIHFTSAENRTIDEILREAAETSAERGNIKNYIFCQFYELKTN